jgi:hypothetical protein
VDEEDRIPAPLVDVVHPPVGEVEPAIGEWVRAPVDADAVGRRLFEGAGHAGSLALHDAAGTASLAWLSVRSVGPFRGNPT